MGKFERKIDVITGNSSGIGLATAKRFVEKSSLYHPDCVDCGKPISPDLCLVATEAGQSLLRRSRTLSISHEPLRNRSTS